MKIKSSSIRGFQPIELSITIESKRELMVLCSLLNASGDKITAFVNSNRYGDIGEFGHKEVKSLTDPLWDVFNKELDKC